MSGSVVRSRVHLRSLLRTLGWVLVLGGLAAWFVTLAPRELGGPATFVVVDGVSMEPRFHTGDLVVARSSASYAVGDLVVLQLDSGRVIHRIVDGTSLGWSTQGDHNTWVDPWMASDAQVLGKYWFDIPGVGGWLAWGTSHPWLVALVAALVAALTFVPMRRRRVSSALASVLRSSTRESWLAPGAGGEVVVLAGVAIAFFASIWWLTMAYSSFGLSPSFAVALGAAAVTGLMAYLLAARVFDGAGVAEPDRSLRCLAGRTRRVSSLEVDEGFVPAASALELRSIAEQLRVPVLHSVESGHHSFVVIGEGVSYEWSCDSSD